MTKLLDKNTRYLLLILPAILVVCSITFFFLLRMQVHHLQKEQLFLKQRNVLNRFNDGDLDSVYSIKREFDIQKVNASVAGELYVIGDTIMENPANEESRFGPYRKLTTYIVRNNHTYMLTTYVSSEETKHLFIMVFAIQGLIYMILLFTIIIVNRKLSTHLWRPFYQTLSRLKLYDIHTGVGFSLGGKTGILEFNELNKVATGLIKRNQQAYQSQKQFVENASHEIQTPLAIIRSKVELLMEQPNINGPIAELTSEIMDANNRLSRLNNALLMLTKIDNNQFIEQTDIHLSALTEKLLFGFKDQYANDFPVLRKDIQPGVHIVANPVLMEILLNNLIKNAIIHNVPGGYVTVDLKRNLLSIENTGPSLDIAPELLFERFRKGNGPAKNSPGLGLALVKHICEICHYKISYAYADHIHRLELIFS